MKTIIYFFVALFIIPIVFSISSNMTMEMQLYDQANNLLIGNYLVNITQRNTSSDIVFFNQYNLTTDSDGRVFPILNTTYDYHDEVTTEIHVSGFNVTNRSQVGYVPYSIRAQFVDNFKWDDSTSSINIGKSVGNLSTNKQTAVGYQAGLNNTADYQTAIGYQAGVLNIGTIQSVLGYRAGAQNTGQYQTAIGGDAGGSNIGVGQNAFGYLAGGGNQGAYQTAIGYYAGNSAESAGLCNAPNTGTDNILIGRDAGTCGTGSNEIGIGGSDDTFSVFAFATPTLNRNTGNNVIGIGMGAGYRNTGSDSIFLGYQAGLFNNLPNQLIIQNRPINIIPLIQGDFATGFVNMQNINISGVWCNTTNCYNLSDFLSGGTGTNYTHLSNFTNNMDFYNGTQVNQSIVAYLSDSQNATFNNLNISKLWCNSTNCYNLSDLVNGQTVKYLPTSYFTLYGTESGGNNLGNLSVDDSNYFNITEASGVNAMEFYVNFTGVSTFNLIQFDGKYQGSSTHQINVYVWDVPSNDWEYYFTIESSTTEAEKRPNIAGESHISSGLVQLKFLHIGTGISTHLFSIDEITLINELSGGQADTSGFLTLDGLRTMRGTLQMDARNINGTGNITMAGIQILYDGTNTTIKIPSTGYLVGTDQSNPFITWGQNDVTNIYNLTVLHESNLQNLTAHDATFTAGVTCGVPLGTASGGTNTNSITSNTALYLSSGAAGKITGASVLGISTGGVLMFNALGAPFYSTATRQQTLAAGGQLLYSKSSNTEASTPGIFSDGNGLNTSAMSYFKGNLTVNKICFSNSTWCVFNNNSGFFYYNGTQYNRLP